MLLIFDVKSSELGRPWKEYDATIESQTRQKRNDADSVKTDTTPDIRGHHGARHAPFTECQSYAHAHALDRS